MDLSEARQVNDAAVADGGHLAEMRSDAMGTTKAFPGYEVLAIRSFLLGDHPCVHARRY